jgi:hypothetical protein
MLVAFGEVGDNQNQMNQDRTRVRNAIQSWVATWNQDHPAALFSGTMTDVTWDEDLAGVVTTWPALEVQYVCQDYSGIEAAERAIDANVNSNAFREIVSLSTGKA